MNYTIVIHSLRCGGAERVAANLSYYWAEKGNNVTIITFAGNELDFYKLHLKVRRISLNMADESVNFLDGVKHNFRRFLFLRRIIYNEKPDVVIGMMPTANILAILSATGISCKVIGSEHNYPPHFPLNKAWECLRKFVYPRADAIVALTTEGVDYLKNNAFNRKVVAIPNPVCWPIESHPPIIDPSTICNHRSYILLAVGRLSLEKGFDLLLSAFANLSSSFPNWDLVIVGEGPERQNLINQIRFLGLTDRVKMPGVVGNIGDWYNRADLYVMSSRFEGFGNTLVEAMAYGCPVVSFDCETGPRNIVRHEVDGLLVPHADVNALTDALARLMSSKQLRNNYSSRAVEVRQRFSLETVGAIWDNLISSIESA
jgi:glycosyltransferase involved in cell wall biosynthesis